MSLYVSKESIGIRCSVAKYLILYINLFPVAVIKEQPLNKIIFSSYRRKYKLALSLQRDELIPKLFLFFLNSVVFVNMLKKYRLNFFSGKKYFSFFWSPSAPGDKKIISTTYDDLLCIPNIQSLDCFPHEYYLGEQFYLMQYNGRFLNAISHSSKLYFIGWYQFQKNNFNSIKIFQELASSYSIAIMYINRLSIDIGCHLII